MTKKADSSADPKGRLTVIDAAGGRQRFLRGMITHDLVQRGLAFDDAYAAARAVRGRLDERDEVSTDEIRDLVQEHLESTLGSDALASLKAAAGPGPTPELTVIKHGHEEPYSRGLLARSIHAAGVDFDRAYRLVADLETALREEGVARLASDEVVRRVGELLAANDSAETARRFQLLRRLDRLPRPLVIYIGGASGTGKSTLALELAPLLRIYRINATDTIRQVMRMVFSRQMLPALYTSSFETAPPPGVGWIDELGRAGEGSGGDEGLIASFVEQATRVGVGVRAMVERAAAESMSMVIEGVHLYPPLVPFADLEGAVYQVPLLLGTRDASVHRTRFLVRGQRGVRHAERYLERFAAIRTIHDFLLHQADHHDVPLLDSSYAEPPVMPAVRLITTLLERKLPALGEAGEPVGPALLLIIDGLADRPVRALGGRTPLAAARTPTLDRLAREGRCGLADPIAPGVVPDTAAGSLALFGQPPQAMKRGPIEALGAGLALLPGDIALRGNFATVDRRGRVLDRRAGRIREDAAALAAALDRLPLPGHAGDVEVRVKEATEHRLAIILRGVGLSPAIRGSDPGDGAAPGPALAPEPTDPEDERAVYSAGLLALFEQQARRVLGRHPINRARQEAGLPAANAVLTRGAGRVHRLPPLEADGARLRWSCIGGDRTVLGLAGWLGAEVIAEPGMTANLDTDLGAKLAAAERALRRRDLVVVHLKGADIAAHDRRPELKVAFLERVDGALTDLLARWRGPLRIAVAGDHATLSESGQHAADPLPVLIWGTGVGADEVSAFDESAAAHGDLQRFPLQLLLGRLFEHG